MPAFDELLERINDLSIVDTHEHLPAEEDWNAAEHDVLEEWLCHYISSDLVSAGLPPADLERARESSQPIAGRWEIIEPFWHAARNTGYARCLETAARELYGLPGLSGDTIEELDAEFRKRREAARSGKSYYRRALKDEGRIAVSLNDSLTSPGREADRDLFREVYRIEGLVDLCHPAEFEELGGRVGFPLHTLDDYAEAAEAQIERALERGAVALKVPFAYSRSLRFQKRTRREAEEAFNSMMGIPAGMDVGRRLTGKSEELIDWMVHRVMRLADRKGLAVQVHTGLQEGSGNIISNSNPELLSNLLLEYRNVRFDVFHISYPYQGSLSAMAKNFPNCFVDMCWMHIISPEAAVRALGEFLDTVPANKISAFGGDFLFPDGAYGHQRMARENVARALAAKVELGALDIDRAGEIAEWLFVENPKRIFRLEL